MKKFTLFASIGVLMATMFATVAPAAPTDIHFAEMADVVMIEASAADPVDLGAPVPIIAAVEVDILTAPVATLIDGGLEPERQIASVSSAIGRPEISTSGGDGHTA